MLVCNKQKVGKEKLETDCLPVANSRTIIEIVTEL